MGSSVGSSGGWSRNLGSNGGLRSSGGGLSRKRRPMRIKAQSTSSGAPVDEHCVLGVSPSASRREIKAAYRRLALQYHPDVCKEDDCEQRFRQIKDAYEALVKRVQEQSQVISEAYDRSYDEEWEEWVGYEVAVPWWVQFHVTTNQG